MTTVVSAKEFLWREWVLGREQFAKFGPRNYKRRPDVGYGGPGQKPVPQEWWQRLEDFLIRDSNGDPEPDRKVPVINRIKARIPQELELGDVRLSAHFTSKEFNCKNGQRVPKAAIPALRELCVQFLEPMRAEFGVCHVLSGYRPRLYNASVGGAKYSQHIYELTPASVAADTMYAKGNPRTWAVKARAIANRRKEGGVGQYDKQGFVHIDNGPRRNWP